MKKYFAAGLVLLSTILLCFACDEVAPNDRLISVAPPTIYRNVLIEDFTGQGCLNCPKAHELIDSLQGIYGAEKVIAVSHHGGFLSLWNSGSVVGLRTSEGDAYTQHWNIIYKPSGLINRSGNVLPREQWISAVHAQLSRPTAVQMSLALNYDSSTRSLTIRTTLQNDTVALDGKLQLWLVEDSVKAVQKMPDGTTNLGYQHRDVFRKAINGLWGEKLSLASAQRVVEEHRFTIPSEYRAEHLSVVAFVYTDNGVEQVVAQPLISNSHVSNP